MQDAVLANQIPLAPGAKMIHQGMIILVYHNGNIVNAGMGHAGQDKIYDTVTAGKGDGSHQTHADQLRNQSVITVRKNNTDYICA